MTVRRRIRCVGAELVWLLVFGLTAGTTSTRAEENATGVADEKVRLLSLINRERAQHGMAPLRVDDKLAEAAQRWSVYMAERGHFQHLGQDGSTPRQRAKEAGYEALGGWENIARGHTTAQATFDSWMKSDGHRANMLRRELNDVGFGIARDGQGVMYWTLLAGIGADS